jgi:hypothetical protein
MPSKQVAVLRTLAPPNLHTQSAVKSLLLPVYHAEDGKPNAMGVVQAVRSAKQEILRVSMI